MPFRTFYAQVEPGKSECVYVAREGDVSVRITTMPLPGQSQASSGYNFSVGGPELGNDGGGGLYLMQSDWESDVEQDDEIWVAIPRGELAWTAGDVPLTVMVRSSRGWVAGERVKEDSAAKIGADKKDPKKEG